jgi:hypothetical protein
VWGIGCLDEIGQRLKKDSGLWSKKERKKERKIDRKKLVLLKKNNNVPKSFGFL